MCVDNLDVNSFCYLCCRLFIQTCTDLEFGNACIVFICFVICIIEQNAKTSYIIDITERDSIKKAALWNVSQINGFVTEVNMQHLVFLVKSPFATAAIVCVISQWVEIFFHIPESNKTEKAFRAGLR